MTEFAPYIGKTPDRSKKLCSYVNSDKLGEKGRHALQQAFAEVAIDHAFMHPELLEIAQELIRRDQWIDNHGIYEQFETVSPGSSDYIANRSTELQTHQPDRLVK